MKHPSPPQIGRVLGASFSAPPCDAVVGGLAALGVVAGLRREPLAGQACVKRGICPLLQLQPLRPASGPLGQAIDKKGHDHVA